MKNKRFATRSASLLLSLAMLLALLGLSGCGNSPASSVQQDASVQQSSAAAKVSSAVSAAAPSSSAASQKDGEASASLKTITLEVVHKDGSTKSFEIASDAETLRAALEQEKLIAGDEGAYGLFVKTVDGETVNDAEQEWWCLTKGHEMWSDGVDTTKIADGDVYEFTFTVGY